MDAFRKRIFIPRKRTAAVNHRVEDTHEKTCIPVEDILVHILARIQEERSPKDEPA